MGPRRHHRHGFGREVELGGQELLEGQGGGAQHPAGVADAALDVVGGLAREDGRDCAVVALAALDAFASAAVALGLSGGEAERLRGEDCCRHTSRAAIIRTSVLPSSFILLPGWAGEGQKGEVL